MYHIAGTGLTILILYFISYFLSRIGYYPISYHNKFWNSILAVAFIATAIAGIFMALQISYKWNVPNVKTILKWHVEFGIGMAATGLLHFLWHLSYFGRFFSGENNESDNRKDIVNQKIVSQTDIGINLFVTGFAGSSFQFLMIREIMNISGGYELMAGIFLGAWLIASATGSALAGRSQLADLRKINLVFSLSPLVSLFLMFLFARLFLESGETPSVFVSIISTLLVLIPFCLVSGFTFVRLVAVARKFNGVVPGRSFSTETTGGIVAGILLSLIISGHLGTYKLMLVIILLYLAYVVLTYYIEESPVRLPVKIFFALIISFMVISEPDIFFRQILLPGIKIIDSEDTPYGNISRGDYKGEISVYYNQRLLTYKNDVIEREEDIHYAMLQHETPSSVIMISGGLDSRLPEIMKYPVKKVVYIERDPALARLSVTDSLKDKVIISNSDAFSYIRNISVKADVIIMLVPPPSTLLLNRYYTIEFFGSVKGKLNQGGVFMCSAGTGETYLNDESVNLYSSVFNSLKTVFPHIIPVAGNKLYFIASEHPLSVSFCELTARRGIENLYVSADYLSDDLTGRKSKEIYNLLDHDVKPNTSAFPLAYSYFQSYHFSRDRNEKYPAIVLLIILFVMPLLAVRRRNLVMYFSASALAGYEIIALLTLQLTIGNMYQMTGLIIAGLMSGLAAGSGSDFRHISSVSIPAKGFILVLFYIATALLYNTVLEMESRFLVICIILIISFIPAFITGNIFRELTYQNDGKNTTASVYSADLSGSALGFITVAGFTVPAFGITNSIYFLGGLVFAGFLFGTIANKH